MVELLVSITVVGVLASLSILMYDEYKETIYDTELRIALNTLITALEARDEDEVRRRVAGSCASYGTGYSYITPPTVYGAGSSGLSADEFAPGAAPVFEKPQFAGWLAMCVDHPGYGDCSFYRYFFLADCRTGNTYLFSDCTGGDNSNSLTMHEEPVKVYHWWMKDCTQ